MTKKKDPADYVKRGRPTILNEEMRVKVEDFINQYSDTKIVKKTRTYPDGSVEESEDVVANNPPFMSELAKFLNISYTSLYKFNRENPEFAHTIEILRSRQLDSVSINALHKRFSSSFAIALNKNLFGWKDKQEISGDKDQPLAISFNSEDKNI